MMNKTKPLLLCSCQSKREGKYASWYRRFGLPDTHPCSVINQFLSCLCISVVVSLSSCILMYHCSSASVWYAEKDFVPRGLFWWPSFLSNTLILQQFLTLMKFLNIYNRIIFLMSSVMGFGCLVSICIHTIHPSRGPDNLIISNTKVITVKIASNFCSNSFKYTPS